MFERWNTSKVVRPVPPSPFAPIRRRCLLDDMMEIIARLRIIGGLVQFGKRSGRVEIRLEVGERDLSQSQAVSNQMTLRTPQRSSASMRSDR